MTWSILLLMVSRTIIFAVLYDGILAATCNTISDIERHVIQLMITRKTNNDAYCIPLKNFSIQTFFRKTNLSEL